MRPIERGAVPTYATGKNTGQPVTFTQYAKWRRHLIDRIGMYCVFCNMPLTHKLEVEHERPKSLPGVNPLAWDNLALGCNTCNTKKGAKPTDPATHYLPGHHNTHLTFGYVVKPYTYRRRPVQGVFVEPAPSLFAHQQRKAQATIDLVDLNAQDERPNVSNLRWKLRREAWQTVDLSRQDYDTVKADPACTVMLPKLADQIARTAKATGFFSIWFEAFKSHPEVLQRLIAPDVFPGTAPDCFGPAPAYQPLPRNPSNAADPL